MRNGFKVALWLAFAALVITPPAQAQTLFFDYVGFDFESPDPDPLSFGEVGSGYQGVGYVPGLFAPLAADTTANEYTYHFYGLTPTGITPIGDYLVIEYSVGTLDVYEDPKVGGTHGDFGANPPNLESPDTFTDGTLFVRGTLTGFQFIVNVVNGTGSFEASYEVTGGSQLGNVPVDQRTGWTFAGASGNALNIPPGYAHQIDGQNFLSKPTPTRLRTWGSLKARYR